jgi:hypothetical protein
MASAEVENTNQSAPVQASSDKPKPRSSPRVWRIPDDVGAAFVRQFEAAQVQTYDPSLCDTDLAVSFCVVVWGRNGKIVTVDQPKIIMHDALSPELIGQTAARYRDVANQTVGDAVSRVRMHMEKLKNKSAAPAPIRT